MSGKRARALREATDCRRVGFGKTQRWINRTEYRGVKKLRGSKSIVVMSR